MITLKGGLTRVNVEEAERIRAIGGDPAKYLAVPVLVEINLGQPGMIGHLPDGTEVVVVPMLLAIPKANLRATTVLGADGKAPNPLEGCVPHLAARFCLPRARLSREALVGLGADQEDPIPEG